MQLLGALGIGEDVEAEALFRPIGQPFVDGQPVALGLGDLLAVLVEEQLVDQSFGLAPAQHLHDLARLHAAIGQVLAVHLVIDAQRIPAHRPVDLPLQLAHAAKRALLDDGAVLVGEADRARLGIDHLDRHLQHASGLRADRQHRRIGLAAFLAQRRQHDVEDLPVLAQHLPQSFVEGTRIVAIAGRDEFVLETEAVEEFAEHRVVVRGEAGVIGVEGIGHPAQRQVEIVLQQLLVGHVVGHLAQPVHIVGERDQPRLTVFGPRPDQRFEGAAHQRGAQNFLERADMRQPAGAVTGFEQDRRAVGLGAVGIAFEQALRLLERPGLGHACGGDQIVHAHAPASRQIAATTQAANCAAGMVHIRSMFRAWRAASARFASRCCPMVERVSVENDAGKADHCPAATRRRRSLRHRS